MYLYFCFFIIGTCVASFINVVIYRLPKKISVVKGRSYCPNCKHTLHMFDLIPIISYILLKGKCRYCNDDLSIRDTFIEIIGGILAIICFYHYGISWMLPFSFFFFMILLAITWIDIDTMTIPDSLIISCFILGIFSMFIMKLSLIDRVIGMIIISIPLIVMNGILPNCFGGGDIKLIGAGGFLLGYQRIIIAMLLAIFISGSYASYLLLKHKIDRKQYIAFGPYVCMGMLLSLLYGDVLWNYYSYLLF